MISGWSSTLTGGQKEFSASQSIDTGRIGRTLLNARTRETKGQMRVALRTI